MSILGVKNQVFVRESRGDSLIEPLFKSYAAGAAIQICFNDYLVIIPLWELFVTLFYWR